MEIQEDVKSKFDTTLQSLLVIRSLLNDAISYRSDCYSNGRRPDALHGWLNSLDPLYSEIIAKLNKDERKKIDTLFSKFPGLNLKSVLVKKSEKPGRTLVNAKYFDYYFNLCRQLDNELRLLINKYNMGIGDSESSRWAMR